MKRIQIVMATAIVFAIGSAFATRASVNRFSQLAYRQDPGVCTPTSTECNTTGSATCLDGTFQTKPSSSACAIPFTKRNP